MTHDGRPEAAGADARRSDRTGENPAAHGGAAPSRGAGMTDLEPSSIKLILDHQDALIYVSDPTTHELLYASRSLRERAGLGTHGTCYGVLWGRSSPCPRCRNEVLLGPGAPPSVVWEREDESDGRWHRWTDKVITWPDGRRVRLGVGTDVTEHRRAEDALRESRERYRQVLENANEAIVVVQDGYLRYVNPRVVAMSGYTEEELRSVPFIELIHPDDRARVAARHESRVRGEPVPRVTTFRTLAKDGSTHHAECTGAAFTWEGGPATLIFLADVTERVRAEEALKQSEERYRRISELTSDLAYVGRVDEAGTIATEWVAGALERLTGHPPDRFSPSDGWLNLIVEADRCVFVEHLRSLLCGDARTAEYRIVSESSGVRWVRDRAAPVWDDAHTRVAYIYGAIQDVTRQREAEEIQSVLLHVSQAASSSSSLEGLLATIHQQLGRLLDTTNFYVALYDARTDTYAFPYHVDLHDRLDDLTQVQLKKSLTDYVRRTGQAVLVDEETHERLTRAGEIELVGSPSPSWLGVPLRVSKRVIGVVVVQSYSEASRYSARDLEIMTFVSDNIAVAIERKRGEEERERLQAQILHAQKLESLGILAGGIAHDFNNLLTGILGNADLCLMSATLDAPVRQSLAAIRTTAERAADLSRQMLAYSGKGSFVIGPISLNDVVREMGHLLEVSVSKKALLRYQLASELPPIVGDATQIRQVIMNLITNASDAIGEGDGVISISTGAVSCTRADLATGYLDDQLPEGPYVFVAVEDTGCGMDGATLQRVFDPFFTTKFTGRGLGLAAALGIVRGHKGAIQVESEVGRGTRFRILLPVADEEASVGEQRPEHAARGRPSGTILVVDDEPSVRDIGARMLEQAGLTVVTAADGREAVEFLREHPGEVSCVLLDLSMPHMGGEETYRELRRISADLPVILSSGYSEQEVVGRFAGQGIAGFVQKPYLVAQLVARVGAAMRGGAAADAACRADGEGPF